MGLIDKIPGLGGLFGSDDVVLGLDEAVDLFRERTSDERSEAREQVDLLEDELDELFGELRGLVVEMEGSSASEEMGRTSERVKDDYCRKLLNIIDGYDFSDTEDLEEFIDKMSPSRRQVGHMQGYFGEELREIRGKIREIRGKVEEMRGSREVIEDHEEVFSLKDEIEEVSSEIGEVKGEIPVLKEDVENLEDEVKELKDELSGFEVEPDPEIQKKLGEINTELDKTRDKLVSRLGVLKRVLRKYTYTTGREVKHSDEPHKIALEDSEKLLGLVEKIIDLDESNEIDIDGKKLDKIKKIRDNFDEIQKEINKHSKYTEETDKLKRKAEESLKPKKEKKKTLKRSLEEKEKELRNKKELIDRKEKKLEELREKREKIKKQIKTKISSYIQENLEIKENE